ncbi:hypothetical protein CBER1_02350 [Cercospora berteroae]|uniref:Uncharacterized protein n=1 Tax=Cercospora berteroae TaxID=357750 RepID=A0A2S6CLX7_9PEZI|nr:hypothetical protein CBER1_02350 [Cercospora berteroae]
MALSNFTTALNATMRAVVWQGNAHHASVLDVPRPTIINQTDAIVRLKRAGICGSDLHIYRGTQPGPEAAYVLGHEGVGYISEVGDAVGSLSVGDPVVIPFELAEGHLHTELTTPFYGSYGNGPELGGTQAEYIRIPNADAGLIPVPSFERTDPRTNETVSLLNDYTMLSDIFPTGWAALDYAGFQTGDTVAIFGAGPVGLQAAYSAVLRGASRIYIVDYIEERLQLAESIGAIPINFLDSDPVEQILAREPNGVTRSIDAVGFEQVNRNLTVQADVIAQNQLRVTSVGGGLGTVGVYNSAANSSEYAPRAESIQENVQMSLADFFTNELGWQAGPSDPIALAPALRQLILSGRASPGLIVSDVISIEEVPEIYRRFERHELVKAVIDFPDAE